MKGVAAMKDIRSLDNIKVGQEAFVERVELEVGIKHRLEDLGVTEGTRLECMGVSPLGDPIALLADGTDIAIRKRDCKKITVSFGSEV